MSLLLFFLSCSSDPFRYRPVEVILPAHHSWEEAQHQSFWYTLVWSEGGQQKQLHLKAGEKRVTLFVRRSESVVFCAYPLGEFAPYGGALPPNGEGEITLTEQEGVLCHLLLEGSLLNTGALGGLSYVNLLKEARSKCEDFALIAGPRLQKDLVNGELSSSSIQVLEPLEVMITSIPQGYWIAERRSDDSFWSYWDSEGTPLLLGGGLHCYWNREHSLLLRVFVDLEERTSFVSLRKGPLW